MRHMAGYGLYFPQDAQAPHPHLHHANTALGMEVSIRLHHRLSALLHRSRTEAVAAATDTPVSTALPVFRHVRDQHGWLMTAAHAHHIGTGWIVERSDGSHHAVITREQDAPRTMHSRPVGLLSYTLRERLRLAARHGGSEPETVRLILADGLGVIALWFHSLRGLVHDAYVLLDQDHHTGTVLSSSEYHRWLRHVDLAHHTGAEDAHGSDDVLEGTVVSVMGSPMSHLNSRS